MIEKIFQNIYKLEIPLPNNPLKALNSYIIKGKKRNLIIDTGMNRDECLDAMVCGLKELKINLHDTDLYITHLHADHIGLASELSRDDNVIYFNKPDSEIVENSSFIKDMMDFSRISGFPGDLWQKGFDEHPGIKFRPTGPLKFSILNENDILTIDDYNFRCISTTGHTPGHMCLYDKDKKLLISGDHILGTISPNIGLLSDDYNPLKHYLESLDKINLLDIDITLPGHRNTIHNCKERIEELKHHHAERADEVLDILKSGSKDSYQTASLMTWDMTYKSWDDFPVTQKWFATTEARAHLKYLEEDKLIYKEAYDDVLVYSLA